MGHPAADLISIICSTDFIKALHGPSDSIDTHWELSALLAG